MGKKTSDDGLSGIPIEVEDTGVDWVAAQLVEELNLVVVKEVSFVQVVFLKVRTRAEARQALVDNQMSGHVVLVMSFRPSSFADLVRARLITDPEKAAGFATMLAEVYSAAYHDDQEVEFMGPCQKVIEELCRKPKFKKRFQGMLESIRERAKKRAGRKAAFLANMASK